MPMKLRGYDAADWSDQTGVDTGSETLVQQQFVEEQDINTIVKRFQVTGAFPMGPDGPAVYGDFSGITDYDSALETIDRAERSFMALPAEVRDRFKNNPANLINWANEARDEEEFLTRFAVRTEPPVVAPVVG